ncbi:MAG: hypothetical protein A2284_11635 [Deltaproteobacteria bacterium RIFOXYA12_FULL_61_11]|nr:MAG: hypothetical protein A2284_11635 [Deltaproteobacteria bacterium RIFOXYA12_FULL_61_11]
MDDHTFRPRSSVFLVITALIWLGGTGCSTDGAEVDPAEVQEASDDRAGSSGVQEPAEPEQTTITDPDSPDPQTPAPDKPDPESTLALPSTEPIHSEAGTPHQDLEAYRDRSTILVDEIDDFNIQRLPASTSLAASLQQTGSYLGTQCLGVQHCTDGKETYFEYCGDCAGPGCNPGSVCKKEGFTCIASPEPVFYFDERYPLDCSLLPKPAPTPEPPSPDTCLGVQHCTNGNETYFEYCGDCSGAGCRPGFTCSREGFTCKTSPTEVFFFDKLYQLPCDPQPPDPPSPPEPPALLCQGVQHCTNGGETLFEYCGNCTGAGCQPGFTCGREGFTCETYAEKKFYFDTLYPVECRLLPEDPEPEPPPPEDPPEDPPEPPALDCQGVQHCTNGNETLFEYCGNCEGAGCRPGFTCGREGFTCETYASIKFYFDTLYPVECRLLPEPPPSEPPPEDPPEPPVLLCQGVQHCTNGNETLFEYCGNCAGAGCRTGFTCGREGFTCHTYMDKVFFFDNLYPVECTLLPDPED